MEDHHVDRSGVEAQQCVKLTDTNRSIGLIVLIYNAHFIFALPRFALLERVVGVQIRPQIHGREALNHGRQLMGSYP